MKTKMNFNVFIFFIIAGVFIASPAFTAKLGHVRNARAVQVCEDFDDPHGYCEVDYEAGSKSWGCRNGYRFAPEICIPEGWSHYVPPTTGSCELFSDVCEIYANNTKRGFFMECTRTYRYSIVSNICEWTTPKGDIIGGPCKDFTNDDHGECEISNLTSWRIICRPDYTYVTGSAQCTLINPPPEDDTLKLESEATKKRTNQLYSSMLFPSPYSYIPSVLIG